MIRTPLLVKEGLGEVVIMGRAPKRDFGLYPTLPPLTKGRNRTLCCPSLFRRGWGGRNHGLRTEEGFRTLPHLASPYKREEWDALLPLLVKEGLGRS
jgi:hypothetical protein